MKQLHCIASVAATFVASALFLPTASATPYAQTDLVSDVPGLAQITDANLKNPWGMSFSASSPFWISNQDTNTSTLYRVTNGVVAKQALTVTIPTTATGPQGPTGQVFNSAGAGAFVLPDNAAATFIFADLNGQISAWNGAAGTAAVTVAPSAPGRVFTGLAIAGAGVNARLYAASSIGITVFNSAFGIVPGGFVNNDPLLAGLVPFNVQTIGTSVYVTYAPAGRAAQTTAAEGSGAVAVFDTSGNLLQTLITGSRLASPWGVALAPIGFGGFGGDLLIGNFSFDVAEINAFDPITGAYLGTIADQTGTALVNSGLWGIAFGNGVTGDANTLYFNAGINNEVNGLFGAIRVVPEPEGIVLLLAGMSALLVALRRNRR